VCTASCRCDGHHSCYFTGSSWTLPSVPRRPDRQGQGKHISCFTYRSAINTPKETNEFEGLKRAKRQGGCGDYNGRHSTYVLRDPDGRPEARQELRSACEHDITASFPCHFPVSTRQESIPENPRQEGLSLQHRVGQHSSPVGGIPGHYTLSARQEHPTPSAHDQCRRQQSPPATIYLEELS
jgi:hypothetical protein